MRIAERRRRWAAAQEGAAGRAGGPLQGASCSAHHGRLRATAGGDDALQWLFSDRSEPPPGYGMAWRSKAALSGPPVESVRAIGDPIETVSRDPGRCEIQAPRGTAGWRCDGRERRQGCATRALSSRQTTACVHVVCICLQDQHRKRALPLRCPPNRSINRQSWCLAPGDVRRGMAGFAAPPDVSCGWAPPTAVCRLRRLHRCWLRQHVNVARDADQATQWRGRHGAAARPVRRPARRFGAPAVGQDPCQRFRPVWRVERRRRSASRAARCGGINQLMSQPRSEIGVHGPGAVACMAVRRNRVAMRRASERQRCRQPGGSI